MMPKSIEIINELIFSKDKIQKGAIQANEIIQAHEKLATKGNLLQRKRYQNHDLVF